MACFRTKKALEDNEKWFSRAQKEYVTKMKPAVDWLKAQDMYSDNDTSQNIPDTSQNMPDTNPDPTRTNPVTGAAAGGGSLNQPPVCDDDTDSVTSSVADVLSASEFLNILSMPKVEIDKFDGNPIDYQNFMAIFDELIGNKLADDQVKLTRLVVLHNRGR